MTPETSAADLVHAVLEGVALAFVDGLARIIREV
jgi:sugar (pentulose or hexulose) kinase